MSSVVLLRIVAFITVLSAGGFDSLAFGQDSQSPTSYCLVVSSLERHCGYERADLCELGQRAANRGYGQTFCLRTDELASVLGILAP